MSRALCSHLISVCYHQKYEGSVTFLSLFNRSWIRNKDKEKLKLGLNSGRPINEMLEGEGLFLITQEASDHKNMALAVLQKLNEHRKSQMAPRMKLFFKNSPPVYDTHYLARTPKSPRLVLF